MIWFSWRAPLYEKTFSLTKKVYFHTESVQVYYPTLQVKVEWIHHITHSRQKDMSLLYNIPRYEHSTWWEYERIHSNFHCLFTVFWMKLQPIKQVIQKHVPQ